MVLYGYQGADREAEKLALTDQLLDAAWLLVISTWSPPKSLAWQKGFRLGSWLIWKLLGLWLLVSSLGSPASAHGTLLVGPKGTL